MQRLTTQKQLLNINLPTVSNAGVGRDNQVVKQFHSTVQF